MGHDRSCCQVRLGARSALGDASFAPVAGRARPARWRGVRFAHLIESDGPGGAERMVASVAAGLQAAGSENIIVVPAAGEGWLARELSGTGVLVEPFRLERPFSPTFARWLTDTL